jgi:hypothetical protein
MIRLLFVRRVYENFRCSAALATTLFTSWSELRRLGTLGRGWAWLPVLQALAVFVSGWRYRSCLSEPIDMLVVDAGAETRHSFFAAQYVFDILLQRTLNS